MFDNKITKKISKEEFKKLDEKNLMFITNPGRMGDEDGITFSIKEGNNYTLYRVSGWMYKDDNDENITFNDAEKQFPMWIDTWNNYSKEGYSGKYNYIYMGFGNGLCIDKSIYDEFITYLIEEVKNHESYDPSKDVLNQDGRLYFNIWKKAYINFINNK